MVTVVTLVGGRGVVGVCAEMEGEGRVGRG